MSATDKMLYDDCDCDPDCCVPAVTIVTWPCHAGTALVPWPMLFPDRTGTLLLWQSWQYNDGNTQQTVVGNIYKNRENIAIRNY